MRLLCLELKKSPWLKIHRKHIEDQENGCTSYKGIVVFYSGPIYHVRFPIMLALLAKAHKTEVNGKNVPVQGTRNGHETRK